MNDMGNVRPLGIRCNHKIREYSCCIYVGSVHARSLTRAHTCTVMYMSAGRFLHSPGHDCICKSVRSGQYCMADTIASDTGISQCQGCYCSFLFCIWTHEIFTQWRQSFFLLICVYSLLFCYFFSSFLSFLLKYILFKCLSFYYFNIIITLFCCCCCCCLWVFCEGGYTTPHNQQRFVVVENSLQLVQLVFNQQHSILNQHLIMRPLTG